MTDLQVHPVDIDTAGNATELDRFAELLGGALGPELLARALTRADPDRPATIRGWAVRVLLSEGHELEAGVAADVDVPASIDPDADDDGLAARFARSSPLQRSVAVLRWHQDLDVPSITRSWAAPSTG